MPPIDLSPLWLTVRVAFWATLIATVAGVAIAQSLATARFRGRTIVEAATAVPLVLPPTVLGYYLLVLIGRDSAAGRFYESITGGPLVFTWQGAVVAAATAAAPYVVRTSRAALESVDAALLEAARMDGATRAQLFLQVSVPIARSGILAGVALAAARSMGEFGATLMVAGNIPGRTQTMSLAVYDAVQAGRFEAATVLAVALTAAAVAILAIVGRLGGAP
jgi:molybdate transport system permease protein